MPRARTDGRMLVRSGFFATPRMLAGDTESCDSSICLSSMFLSPLPFQTTEAPAERGERSEERVKGKSVSVRVDLGGRRIIKKKKHLVECVTEQLMVYYN